MATGPGQGRPGPTLEGQGQTEVALALALEVRSGASPRARVHRPCPWTVYQGRHGQILESTFFRHMTLTIFFIMHVEFEG